MFSNHLIRNQQEEAGHLLYKAIEAGNAQDVDELLSLTDYFPELYQVKPEIKTNEEVLGYPYEHPLALATHNPRIFEKILYAYSGAFSLFDIENALKKSVWIGLWDPIELLLRSYPVISDDCKGVALRISVQMQHANITQKILELFSSKINKVYKLISLRCALINQNIDILNLLLRDDSVIEASIHSIKSVFQQVGINFPHLEPIKPGYEEIVNQITSVPGVSLIREIYLECSKEYSPCNDIENENIRNFLKENSHKIKKGYKKAALELAVAEGRVDILNALLSDSSIKEIATWNNNITLREAKRSYAENKARIVSKLMRIPAVALLEKAESQNDKSLLEQYMKPSDKGRALVIASENDNLDFAKSILTVWRTQISEKYKMNALAKAIEEEKLDTFLMLLEDFSSFPKQLNDDNKGRLFNIAIVNGSNMFVKLMIEKWHKTIPALYMKDALVNAVRGCHINVFDILLENEVIFDIVMHDKVFESALRQEIQDGFYDAETDEIATIYQRMVDKLNMQLTAIHIVNEDQNCENAKNKLSP